MAQLQACVHASHVPMLLPCQPIEAQYSKIAVAIHYQIRVLVNVCMSSALHVTVDDPTERLHKYHGFDEHSICRGNGIVRSNCSQ